MELVFILDTPNSIFCYSIFALLVLLIFPLCFGDILHHSPVWEPPPKTCSLVPMEYGVYYGVESLSHGSASECCSSKNLSMFQLASHSDAEIMEASGNNNNNSARWQLAHELLLSFPFHAAPIGRDVWLWVKLDNWTEEGFCPGIYFKSPRNMTLIEGTISCNVSTRYLCEVPPEGKETSKSLCENAKFVPLSEKSYQLVKTPMSWKDALTCCESRQMSLARPSSAMRIQDILSSLQHESIIRRKSNETFVFWTESLRMSVNSTFSWFNYRKADYLSFEEEQTEHCLAALAQRKTLKLIQRQCESALPFICQIPDVVHVENVILENIELHDSVTSYWYSGNVQMSWKDAASFCLKKGLHLFSIVSPLEGHAVAAALQTHPQNRNRHMSRHSGVWTSGRADSTGKYSFIYNLAKVDYDNPGVKVHFIKASATLEQAHCIQFVVDIRNSFFLTNTPCITRRSFICETPETTVTASSGYLEELGNQYFYSNPVTHEIANDLCNFNWMSILKLRNEEKAALAELVNNLRHDHTSEARAIWVQPLDPTPILERERITHKNFGPPQYAVIQEILEEKRKAREKSEKPEEYHHKPHIVTTYCDTIYLNTTTKSFIRSEDDCSRLHPVICESGQLRQKYTSPLEKRCAVSFSNVMADYKLSKSSLAWKEAQECCRTIDMELASVKNKYELAALARLANFTFPGPLIGFWTSGTSNIVNYQFVWADSYTFIEMPIFYNNYTRPREIIDEKDVCLEAYMDPEETKLVVSHDHCSNSKRFLCAKKSYKFPTIPCSEVEYVQLSRSHYYLFMSKVPWLKAVECCKAHGTRLVSVPDETANEWLFKFIVDQFGYLYEEPANGIWIGLTSRIFKRDRFFWIGEMVSLRRRRFTSWADSNLTYFNNLTHDACGSAITSNEKRKLMWIRTKCIEHRSFICEKV